jgi:hypothetical protein
MQLTDYLHNAWFEDGLHLKLHKYLSYCKENLHFTGNPMEKWNMMHSSLGMPGCDPTPDPPIASLSFEQSRINSSPAFILKFHIYRGV